MPDDVKGSSRRRAVATAWAVVSVAASLWAHWSVRRHWLPGNWLGDIGFFSLGELVPWVVAFFALVVAVNLLSLQHRFVWLAIVVVAAGLPMLVRWPSDWGLRWKVERSRYEQAARGGSFGDQHEREFNGRKLVFWRWWSGGIDNGEGIVYDPEDRLSLEADFRCFRDLTGGVLWRVERLERGWYYVVFS